MPTGRLQELRAKHSALIYESFTCERFAGNLKLTYQFKLEPEVAFSPVVIIPAPAGFAAPEFQTFVFHLGLIELLSYWKAACPSRIVIRAGMLNDEQIAWWRDLYLHGLGEFFYRNKIDFSPVDFLCFEIDSTREIPSCALPLLEGELVLVGGGKDSSLMLEILRKSECRRKRACVLNPIRSAIDSVRIAQYEAPIVVERSIDPGLIALNAQGYLNGHTPFSAYLAFLGSFVGALCGYSRVLVANESSANEAALSYHGMPINHQYSKSVRFEKRFREYAQKYLCDSIEYFSILRPLNDLQVSRFFAQCTEHHSSFRSCNVGQKRDVWCGECPKCAFVYLTLYPFLSQDRLQAIFGADLMQHPMIELQLLQILGVQDHKPFECVGTIEESRAALLLAAQKHKLANTPLPGALRRLCEQVAAIERPNLAHAQSLLTHWNGEHFLPPRYAKMLHEVAMESSFSDEA